VGGTANEHGISSNSQTDVTVRGPGIVQRFRATGIFMWNSARSNHGYHGDDQLPVRHAGGCHFIADHARSKRCDQKRLDGPGFRLRRYMNQEKQ
jgi:hypothetical protein